MREADFEELRELRARRPELIAARAAQRLRRPLLGADGRLMIVYPHDGDVKAAVDAACALVHDVTVRP